jgi:hypothetical protein
MNLGIHLIYHYLEQHLKTKIALVSSRKVMELRSEAINCGFISNLFECRYWPDILRKAFPNQALMYNYGW